MKKLYLGAILSVSSISAFSGSFDETLQSLIKNFDTGVYSEVENSNDKGCSVFAQDQSGTGKLYLSIRGLDDKYTLQITNRSHSISYDGKEYKSKISHTDTVDGTTYTVETYESLTKEKFCARVLFGGDPCIKVVGVRKEVSEIKANIYGELVGFSVEESELRDSKFKEVESYSCY